MGVKAIAWGQTVIFLSDAIVNMLGAGRYLRWTIWDGIRSTAPYLAMSAVMVAAVYGTHMLLAGHIAPVGHPSHRNNGRHRRIRPADPALPAGGMA